jgi:hypothetical protein
MHDEVLRPVPLRQALGQSKSKRHRSLERRSPNMDMVSMLLLLLLPAAVRVLPAAVRVLRMEEADASFLRCRGIAGPGCARPRRSRPVRTKAQLEPLVAAKSGWMPARGTAATRRLCADGAADVSSHKRGSAWMLRPCFGAGHLGSTAAAGAP